MKENRIAILKYKDLNGSDYIEVRPGKHRKKKLHKESIYFYPDMFSLLDDIIWDKYREYSPTTTNVIRMGDWERILEGFQECLLACKSATSLEDLKKALRLRSHDDLNFDQDFDRLLEAFTQFISDFSSWIEQTIKEEKYISICV